MLVLLQKDRKMHDKKLKLALKDRLSGLSIRKTPSRT